MAADPLDGDVRRLRYSGRGGSNDDSAGYRPVRSPGEDGDKRVNDDVFNLTPHDIRKQEFRKSLRGYETDGVEDFRVRAADALERAIRDRQVLEERVSALTEQLRVFREREKAMNEALVAAQQLRQETRAAAEREGQVIVREAQAEAKRLLDEAHAAQTAVQVKLTETERQFQQYVGGFRALLERQLAELRALDSKRD
jgi:DivIVA domain-containing protein